MEKTVQLYEGKAKKVYATDDPRYVIVSYKDDATAFDGTKKGTIRGKGAVNNRMSNFLMQKLAEEGVPWRSSSATYPRATSPAATAWRRASSLTSRCWSSPTRTTTSTTPC